MRRAILLLPVFTLLAGCASVFDAQWERQARAQCDQTRPSERGSCHDEVDRAMQKRDRDDG
jgi:uncharacterized protein YceK